MKVYSWGELLLAGVTDTIVIGKVISVRMEKESDIE